MKEDLISNIDELHTTRLGIDRIRRNLCLDIDDVVDWCKEVIKNSNSSVFKSGKNYYIKLDNYELVVNSSSYTIITAHKVK